MSIKPTTSQEGEVAPKVDIVLDVEGIREVADKARQAKCDRDANLEAEKRKKLAPFREEAIRILNSIPAAVKEAAKKAHREKEYLHIEVEIPIASGPYNSSAIPHASFSKKDRLLVEAVWEEISQLPRRDDLKLYPSYRTEEIKTEGPSSPASRDYISFAYIQVKAYIPYE